MLCSWGRYFVVLVCSLAFCANGYATPNQRVQNPDRYHWSFLGFHIETAPAEGLTDSKPMGPPECELGATWESQQPFATFEDEGDQIRLDPIQALEMPVDIELESAYQDQFAQQSPNEEQSVIDEFAPVAFPNNGCDFSCYPSVDLTPSDSVQMAPSLPQIPMDPMPIPSIKMDFRHWSAYRLAQATSEISESWLDALSWRNADAIELPIDVPLDPQMDSDLISGPVPPADVECPWAIAPADIIAQEVVENQNLPNLPIDSVSEVIPAETLQPEEIAEDRAPAKESFSSLFHQASSRSVSEIPLPVRSLAQESPAAVIQSAPQMNPSIHLPEVKKNARPITFVFQFNTIQHQPTTHERQSRNDRIVGSGISVGHETQIDENEIFDAEELNDADSDAAYWEYYSTLGELGITFPLAQNMEPAPRRMIPAQSASNAFVIPDPQPVLTWEEIQQIPSFAKSLYRDFSESSFFSDPEMWAMELCYRIECELCGTRLLTVWHYVLDTIGENQQKMRLLDEIEARKKEAQRLRYVASHVDRLSQLLDSGARQLTFWALESEGNASASLSSENENR